MTADSSDRRPALLKEFPAPGLDAWRAEVERLLKGAPFEKAMLTRTLEGITLDPMPTSRDTEGLPWLDVAPGQVPFVRGGRGGGYHDAPWLVAQEIPLPVAGDFNAALRHDLARGQTAVNLVLDAAAQTGCDPLAGPCGAVGVGGTSVADLEDLQACLEGVDLARTPVLIDAGAAALPVAAMLAVLWEKKGADKDHTVACLGCDPVSGLAQAGRLPIPMNVLYDLLAVLTEWAQDRPGVRTLPVRETVWHEGGADHALSLGLTVAEALHTLREMEDRGVAPREAVRRVHFHLTVDADFFMSLAKLRALRLLWSGVQRRAGLEPVPAWIHARTSRRMMSAFEPYPNMLRVTTAAMAAVLAMADSMDVAPFDATVGLPDEFGRRIARNVQLILAHECRLDHVTDPAGGAWHPERLTADLAAVAWDHVRDIEKAGGIVAALREGMVQERITAAADARRKRLATGKQVMVGVNRFCDPQAEPPEPRRIDTVRLEADRKVELDGRAPWGSGLGAGFSGMMNAVTAGARISALVEGRPDAVEVPAVPPRRDATPFEAIRRRVHGSGDGPRTRVGCVCLGDPARYMPRLDFVRGFFTAGGFTVIAEGFATTAAEAARLAGETDARTLVLVGLDETYGELAAPAARLLKDTAPVPRVILAGRPGDLEAELTAAGVDGFLHARSDMLEILGRLADNPEVAS